MILSGSEILKQVDLGNIVIDPLDRDSVNPNSYNYRLGDRYAIVPPHPAASGDGPERGAMQTIPSSGLVLQPGQVYLATTFETIGSDRFVTLLIGRSSVGRLGLFLQISADLGNLGPSHKWTLELTCVQPIVVYPHMKIGQVSFWVPVGPIENYTGPYTNYDDPTHCIYERLLSH